ncbi:unnamed protein product [Lactuca saligna]|uniref:Replication protein A 70 kDa DNA-binding subunit B/D first OB fold domain-containing protein n=1 Tax=Lactuca saligna TaxID=75948 RepID=A0AA35Z3U3_LACSI|nr:unnamed protein product [Lactuca saligna]
MEIGNKVYLNNIDQIDEKSHIKVRVLKIWNFVRNNKVCSIEMIIMDEEGTQYQARVFNQNFSRFRHLLKEDESYIVIKPNMVAVTNGFSYTDITEYNVNNYNNIYTVLRVTENMSIVCELESKIELMSNQSVSLNQVALESDDVVQPVQKDVISQTDESFTPSTVDKSTATSPCKILGDLKRNLQEIYDVDSGYDLSSTKAKRKSTAEETPLLIPKIEK